MKEATVQHLGLNAGKTTQQLGCNNIMSVSISFVVHMNFAKLSDEFGSQSNLMTV